MIRLSHAVLAAVVTVAASGCLSLTTFQTADTNGRGKLQMALEGSSTGITTPSGSVSIPTSNVAARYGVTDNVDIGARVGTVGGELMAKVRLSGAPGQLSLALAPSVGGISLGGASLLSAQLPVLVGVPLGQHQLVLSPKVHIYRASAIGDTTSENGTTQVTASASLISAGTGVALALKLGESLRIVPELSVIYPLMVTGSASDGSTTETGSGMVNANGAIYQAGIGLLFGGN
jgi:hypothetical protein